MLSSIEVEEWLRPEAESPRDCRERKQNKQISQRLFRADTNSEWDQVGWGCGEADSNQGKQSVWIVTEPYVI